MQNQFERWLLDRRYASSTAYAYSRAINRVSLHYSEKIGKYIDLYNIQDPKVLAPIVNKYLQNGIYSNKGNEGNGTNRAALIQFQNYLEHPNSHPRPRPRPNPIPPDPREKIIDELRSALKASETVIADLRAKGKRVVAQRDDWEQEAKRYEIENARLKNDSKDTARFQRAKAAIIKCLHRDSHLNATRIEIQLREDVFKELWPEIEKIEKR